jgi:hypothetical protein
VPAGVCRQCGEKYLPARVAKTIEHAIYTKQSWREIKVPMVHFGQIETPAKI